MISTGSYIAPASVTAGPTATIASDSFPYVMQAYIS